MCDPPSCQVAGACSVLAFLDSRNAEGGENDAAANGELADFGLTQVLKPGESETVHLTIAATVVSLVDDEGTERIAPGVYGVTIGVKGAMEDDQLEGQGLLHGTLTLSGDAATVFSLNDAKARANAKSVHGAYGVGY